MRKKILFLGLFFVLLLSLIFLGVQKIPSFQHNPFAALVSGFFPFWQKNQPSIPDENINLGVNQDISAELVEKLDDREEQIDVLNQKIAELEKELEYFKNKTLTRGDAEELADEKELEEGDDEDEEKIAEEAQKTEKKLCEKISGAQLLRNKIIINEVAWMGGSSSVSDEWIELKNISGTTVNLENWQILDKDQQIKIVFTNKEKILGNGFFLLERTGDNTVPGIAADFIYTGTLSNTDEALYLFDENCQPQDKVLAESDWPAGDNSSKRTMERRSDLSWQTSLNPNGTPRAENSSGYVVPPVIPTGGGGGGSSSPPPSYPKILISEIQIGAVGNEKEEFVELYNPNPNDLVLTSWYLQRKTKNASNYSTFASSGLFESKIIKGKDYFLIARENSSFAADADVIVDNPLTEDNTLVLKNPNQEIVDKVGWGEAQDFETAPTLNPPVGKSIGRKWVTETEIYQDRDDNSADFEIQQPTPKIQNQSPVTPSQDTTPPQVSFNPISSLQTNLSFIISWSGEDLAPEGVTPSGIEGFQLRYSEDKENWIYWPSESEYTQETQYNFTGEDEKIYYFQIKAKDKAGNESDWIEIMIEVNAQPMVINEVYYDVFQDNGEEEGKNEWVEIYNRTNQIINISGWEICDNNSCDTLPISDTISAKGFAIITAKSTTFDFWNIPVEAIKIVLDNNIGNGLANGGDRIILKKDSIEIDAVSWGTDNYAFGEGNGVKPLTGDGKSIARINPNIDTDTSSDWLILETPNPGQ